MRQEFAFPTHGVTPIKLSTGKSRREDEIGQKSYIIVIIKKMRTNLEEGTPKNAAAFRNGHTDLEIDGFFRTRVFVHEFSALLLQLVFRWGDTGT